MNLSQIPAADECYLALLTAGEQALGSQSQFEFGSVPEDFQEELKRDLACVDLLREILPAIPPPSAYETLPYTGEPSAPPGACLGRFHIRRELGRGTFGIVYLAYDPRLEREVALKVPRVDALVDPEMRKRFYREAKAAAGLKHPNVVPVYEAGEAGPVCYIASEYCAGVTLARWLKDRSQPVPFRLAASLVARLAEAVDHAHQNGVVHRDLKPGNVLLGSKTQIAITESAGGGPKNSEPGPSDLELTPKITDFGLARFMLGEDATQTGSGAMLGTPNYMAPEQAGGRNREIGPAADVYALGVILYELLTGRPPFQAESVVDTLVLLRTQEPVSPTRLRARLPRDLETICLTAMAKNPARRFKTAGAMAEDLQRWLAKKPIRSRPIRSWERAVYWARRRPAVAALLATLFLITVAGFAGVTWQWRRAEATAEALEHRLYFHRIAVAERESRANNLRLADDLLDECPERLRGWEWHYVRRLRYGQPAPLEGHTSAVHALAVHPEGRLLASAGEDNKVMVWDLTGVAPPIPLDGHTKQVRSVAFSADGHYLASAGLDGNVFVWKRTGENWQKLPGWSERGQINSVAFHPDSRHLAWRDWDSGTIVLGDLETWQVVPTRCVQPNESGDITSIAFSLDGQRLAGARGNIIRGTGEVVVWDMASQETELPLQGPIGAFSVAFSPDGRYIAAAGGTMWRGESEVKVWDARTGREIHCLRGYSGQAMPVVFSPDSRRVVAGGRDKIIKMWDVATGLEALALHGHNDSVRCLAFSPDGKRLFSGGPDLTIRIWDATPLDESTGPERATLTGHTARLSCVATSSDGRWIASADLNGVVRIWHARTYQEVWALGGHEGGVLCVAFNHDSRMLASAGEDGTTKIWDPKTGDEISAPSAPPKSRNWITSLAFSPDDRLALSGGLVTGTGGAVSTGPTIALWDAKVGKALPGIEKAHSWFIQCLAFSPDGRWLASTSADGKVKVWDAKTLQQVGNDIILKHKGRPLCVVFSPDSQRLVCAGLNKKVTILDTRTWEEILVFDQHTDQVNSVAFSPDGQRIASASNDTTIRVWNAATGETIDTLRGHRHWVESVAFSSDGTEIVSASWDKTVKVWKAPALK